MSRTARPRSSRSTRATATAPARESSARAIRCRCSSATARRSSSAAPGRCSARSSRPTGRRRRASSGPAAAPGSTRAAAPTRAAGATPSGARARPVLYTDGVTDARGERARFGDARLLELLSSVDGAPPAELVRLIDGALRGFESGPQRDDTAMLAVGRLEAGELALAGGPEAVSLARAAVRSRLDSDGALPPERLGDVLLLTSELVTNAIRHGGAAGPDDRIRLRVLRQGSRARIEVRDDGPGFARPPRDTRPSAEGGMGLGLVDRLASAWGTDRTGRSTLVWFEVEPDRPAAPVH